MALVDYSDSGSDDEALVTKEAPKVSTTAKAGFQKAAPGRIKVELPSFKPEPGQEEVGGGEGPPAKRARNAGAFSGFNSALPPPKRTAQNAPKAGVSLKTSSEAAFSRNPPPKPIDNDEEYDGAQLLGNGVTEERRDAEPPEEPKMVGKATRFLPLSVSSKKKKKPVARPPQASENVKSKPENGPAVIESQEKGSRDVEHPPKPRRSLFSVQQDETLSTTSTSGVGAYEPMLIHEERTESSRQDVQHSDVQTAPTTFNSNSLEATAAELNLTPAQRRQLFGRSGGKDANVMHFNLDNEYAANEQARQAGEVVEHRAIKSIAPGKHSLQQLVNNARTQQDAMEDKWAEGRRNRGEGGSKYGWS